jgi:hypothetical protein
MPRAGRSATSGRLIKRLCLLYGATDDRSPMGEVNPHSPASVLAELDRISLMRPSTSAG